jgi:hypothetical protein
MSLYRAQGKMRFYLDKLQENYGRTQQMGQYPAP